MRKIAFPVFLTVVVFLPFSCSSAQESANLRISGSGIQTIEISMKDLPQMPRLSVEVREPHKGEIQHYDGLRLADLLLKREFRLGTNFAAVASRLT